MEIEKCTALNGVHILGKKFCVYSSSKVITRLLHIDKHSQCGTLRNLNSDMVPFGVVCHQDWTSKPLAALLYITFFFPIIGSLEP